MITHPNSPGVFKNFLFINISSVSPESSESLTTDHTETLSKAVSRPLNPPWCSGMEQGCCRSISALPSCSSSTPHLSKTSHKQLFLSLRDHLMVTLRTLSTSRDGGGHSFSRKTPLAGRSQESGTAASTIILVKGVFYEFKCHSKLK